MKRTVLLLAGTAEARHLSEQFQSDNLTLVASLAGVTRTPVRYPCDTRTGGFGGVDGLVRWIVDHEVVAVIDATHPFAEQISKNAKIASNQTDTPFLTLRRDPWKPGRRWKEFTALSDLAAALPTQARVLLTTGRKEISSFAHRLDVSFLLRTIEPIEGLPSHITQVLARPPFSEDQEIKIMKAAQITHLVTKNAGGTWPSKLVAVEALAIEIFSLAMPPAPNGAVCRSVNEALGWLKSLEKSL